MKLIESKAEYIPQEDGLEGIYKQIELAGRTCYKSEDKIVNVISIDIADLPEGITVKNIPNYKTNQQQCIEYLRNHKIKYQIISSAKAFVDRMIKSKHTAMLEHGTVYLKLPPCIGENEIPSSFIFLHNPYSKVSPSFDADYVTTNYRVLIENNLLDNLQYLCSPTEFHERRYTIRFTCSRAISHELVRARTMSFAQESQRYINYSKERHGGEITFIIPSWFEQRATFLKESLPNDVVLGAKVSSKINSYNDREMVALKVLALSERNYMYLLGSGLTPQQARDVLPNATKTELIMTGFASDWRFLMDLRLFEKTGAVHSDMKDLMQKAKKTMQEAGIWEDIISKPSKFD